MQTSDGFSLIEVLISLAVSCIVLVAFVGAAGEFQTINWNLSQLAERDSNLSLVPLMCAKWLSGAGNNRWDRNWTGLSREADALVARADMEGTDGFPDGALTESFESIALRRSGTDFQIRSNGGTYQPAAKNIGTFAFDNSDSCLLRLTFSGITDRPLMRVRAAAVNRLEFDVYLWNYRPNLFAEKP